MIVRAIHACLACWCCLLPGAIVVTMLPAPVAAQSTPERYLAQRLTGPIELDGRSDEPAWQAIEPLRALSSFPDFGAAPSERTEFRVAYDDDFLYFAARMYDSDVTGIRATSLRRDDGSFSNDWFAINLDTFRDRENTLVFGVTPANVRTDVTFTGDGVGANFNWNAFWDARAVVDDDGWHAEIRIPLASLRFEERAGAVVMGMTLWRRIARRNETVSWPAVDHRWGTFSIFKASQMNEIELRGVRRSNPIYVTPYALAGASRTHALNDAGSAFDARDRVARETGLDVKYSPLSNLTMDVTVNTDFAQVEADDQQVNLSRFSLFFPEKRLFFQERASVFDYTLGGSDRLFYSRRIGLDAGQPVRIYGGVRAVGRVAGWDIGLLDMQTAATDARPSENTGVLRLRRRILNDNSYAGTMLTSRVGADGATSLAGGADALLRVAGQDYLSLALSATRNDGDTLGGSERMFARARLERRGIYGLLYNAEVAHVGAAFLPSLGFLARRDHARAAAGVAYGIEMPQASRLLRLNLAVAASAYRRHADGELETAEVTGEWRTESKGGRAIVLSGVVQQEDLTQPFEIASGITVPAGVHRFGSGRIAYEPAGSGLLRVNANVEAGSFFDGRRVSAAITPTWDADRHIQLSGTYQVNRLDFAARDQQLTTHVARLRTLLMLNSALSGVAFVQYNSASDAIVLNGRVRWNMREGNDLYIVYNHGLNADRFAWEPVRPITDNQTLLIKYSHTTTLSR